MNSRLRTSVSVVAVAVGVVTGSVAVPQHAAAKGAETVAISGVGVGRIVLDGRTDDAMWQIAELTLFHEVVFEGVDPDGGRVAMRAARPNTGELGPRLGLAWDMHHTAGAPGVDVPLRQVLYPYAAGGPVLRTPPGQEVYGAPVDGGWHRADPELVEVLTELGVPDAEQLVARQAGRHTRMPSAR